MPALPGSLLLRIVTSASSCEGSRRHASCRKPACYQPSSPSAAGWVSGPKRQARRRHSDRARGYLAGFLLCPCFPATPLLLLLHMKWWWACWLLWHWLCTLVVWATLQVMFLGNGLGLLRRLGLLQAQSGLWLGLGPCALHHNTSLEPPVKSTSDLA